MLHFLSQAGVQCYATFHVRGGSFCMVDELIPVCSLQSKLRVFPNGGCFKYMVLNNDLGAWLFFLFQMVLFEVWTKHIPINQGILRKISSALHKGCQWTRSSSKSDLTLVTNQCSFINFHSITPDFH